MRPLLGIPIELGKCGIAGYSGINPFAALAEMGIKTRILPLSAVMNVKDLTEAGINDISNRRNIERALELFKDI